MYNVFKILVSLLLVRNYRFIYKEIKRDVYQELLSSSITHSEWETLTNAGKKLFLMICHDVSIDRRIVQQASALKSIGWNGLIIGLSDSKDDKEDFVDGIPLHRIGSSKISPDYPVYWAMIARRRFIKSRFSRSISLFESLNFLISNIANVMINRSTSCFYPLPYDYCFYAAALRYKPDLVFAHDLPALNTSVKLAAKWKIPSIYDAHEMYFEQNVFSNVHKYQMSVREKQLVGQCKTVITVNQSIAKIMAKRNNIKEPNVILNATTGVSSDILDKRRYLLHDKLNIPHNEKIALFQGGRMLNRNLENLVTSFTLLKTKKVHLVLLGPSVEQVEKKLLKRAGKLIKKQIHFLEPVPQEELLSHTVSADFGIIPYRATELNVKYCTPNKLFEYLMSALPILISNDLLALKDLLKPIKSGVMFADFGSVNSMARAIELFAEQDLDDGRAELNKMKDTFSWAAEQKKYLKIINNTI